jgi:ribonuclease HI
VELKYWQLRADEAKILEADEHKDQIIHAYTDGSKTWHGVGSGVALYIGTDLALQEKFKLDNRCSNNQAEQLAITKALEAIGKIDITEHTPCTATIFTDSRISIDAIRDTRNHSHLIEEIRKKMSSLERANWNIELSWIKAHVGIVGNELADRLAKAAASDSEAKIVFNRLPMSTLITKIQEETKLKWQRKWEECTKARITKEFFPRVHDRQKLKIDITPILTTMMTGHGKTRAYLHRFKILEHANCPCDNGDQTIELELNWFSILHTQIEIRKRNILKLGNWPASKHELISKHLKSFLLFIKSINFDLL